MAWQVDPMRALGPIASKTAGSTLSVAFDQNNVLQADDIIVVALAFDNLTASTPNVSWGGSFSQNPGGNLVLTAGSFVHGNSPQAGSAAGVRTCLMFVRVSSGAGTLTYLNTVTFSGSINAKVYGVARLRGGDVTSWANFVSRPATDFAVNGGLIPTRTLTNPSGGGDYVVFAVAGTETNGVSGSTNDGSISPVDGTMSANTTGGSAVTNIGMKLSWNISVGGSWSQSAGGASSVDVSTATAMFGNAYVPQVAPTPRTLFVSSVGPGVVNFGWDYDAAASPQATYSIEQSTDGTNFTQVVASTSNQTSYGIYGLTNFQQYWFRIRGSNVNGTSAYSNVVTGTPVSLIRQNNLDWGANLAQLSEFDTGGGQDPFNIYGADNLPIYVSDESYGPPNSARTEFIGANGTSQFGWHFGGGMASEMTARFYLKLTAFPLANTIVCNLTDTDLLGLGHLEILSTGYMRIRSVNADVSVGQIAVGQWVRLELHGSYDFGELRARYYSDPDADISSYDEELYVSTASGITQPIGGVMFGLGSNSGAYSGPAWFDEVRMEETAGWIGPADVTPPAPPTVNAGFFGMIPIF